MSVAITLPTGQVEEAVEGLSTRGLAVTDNAAEVPALLEVGENERQEEEDIQREPAGEASGAPEVSTPTKRRRRRKKRAVEAPVPLPAARDGYRRQGFVTTGESRPPHEGEYYVGLMGYALQAHFDWELTSALILQRTEETAEAEEWFASFEDEGHAQP